MFSVIMRQRADILQMIAGFAVIDLIEPLFLVFCTGTQANTGAILRGCWGTSSFGRLLEIVCQDHARYAHGLASARLRFTPRVSGVYERANERNYFFFVTPWVSARRFDDS